MWLAVTDSRRPTRSLHICWGIYDQVVSGLCPSLGNTTPVLLMEEILYLITSAGAQPVILLTLQNKLAGDVIYVITHAYDGTEFGAANTMFTVYIWPGCQSVPPTANLSLSCQTC